MKRFWLIAAYAIIPWSTMYIMKFVCLWYNIVVQQINGVFGTKYLFIIALEAFIIVIVMYLQSIIERKLIKQRNLTMSGILLLLVVLEPVLMIVAWFTRTMVLIMDIFGLLYANATICQFVVMFSAIIRIIIYTINAKR